MRRIKIQLELSKSDQTALGYQNPMLEWDFEGLLGIPFEFEIGSALRNDIIQAIRKDIMLPDGYLENYRVVYNDKRILVIP